MNRCEPQDEPVAAGWTGGQYSVVRLLLGLWLGGRSVAWAFSGAAMPGARVGVTVGVLGGLAAIAAAMVAIGRRDRRAAITLVGLNAALTWVTIARGTAFVDTTALTRLASLLEPAIAMLLPAAHALTPLAPFGSVDAMGRADPDGGWRLHRAWRATLTALLGLAYLTGGLYLLSDPAWRLGAGLWAAGEPAVPGRLPGGTLTLLPQVIPQMIARAMTWAVLVGWLAFAGIAPVRRLRPWVWLAAATINAVCLPLAGFGGPALALLAWHGMVFDPAWLPARGVETHPGAFRPHPVPENAGLGPRRAARPSERLFYDGHCGLCHRTVRFVLAEDRAGLFLLSPLQSEAFKKAAPATQRERLPDSVVIQQADGTLLVRSAAVGYLLDRLGGLWRLAGWFVRATPRPVADGAYRGIAAVRNRLFTRPAETCPLTPPRLRQRFEL